MTLQNNHLPNWEPVIREYYRSLAWFTRELEHAVLTVIDVLCSQDTENPLIGWERLIAAAQYLKELQQKYHVQDFTIPKKQDCDISDTIWIVISDSRKIAQYAIADINDASHEFWAHKFPIPESFQSKVREVSDAFHKILTWELERQNTETSGTQRSEWLLILREPSTAQDIGSEHSVLSHFLETLLDDFVLTEFWKLHDFIVEQITLGNITEEWIQSTKLYDIMKFLEHVWSIRHKKFHIPETIAKPADKKLLSPDDDFRDIVFDEWCSNLSRILDYVRKISSVLREKWISHSQLWPITWQTLAYFQ